MSEEYDTLSLRNRDVVETLSKVSDFGCTKKQKLDKLELRSSFNVDSDRAMARNWTDPETTPPPTWVDIYWEDVRKHWEQTQTAKDYYLATGGSPIFQMEKGQDHSCNQISYEEDVEEFTEEEEEPYTEPFNASVDEDGIYMFACGVKGHAQVGEIVRIHTTSQDSFLNIYWRDLRRDWNREGHVKIFYLETAGTIRFRPETGEDHQVCMVHCQEKLDTGNVTHCEKVTEESLVMETGVYMFACGVKDHCNEGEKFRVVVSPNIFNH